MNWKKRRLWPSSKGSRITLRPPLLSSIKFNFNNISNSFNSYTVGMLRKPIITRASTLKVEILKMAWVIIISLVIIRARKEPNLVTKETLSQLVTHLTLIFLETACLVHMMEWVPSKDKLLQQLRLRLCLSSMLSTIMEISKTWSSLDKARKVKFLISRQRWAP